MKQELSEELKRFVTAPWLSKAYLAEQLFGNRTKPSTGKLSNKISGAQGQRFKADEIKKLEEVRENIMNNF